MIAARRVTVAAVVLLIYCASSSLLSSSSQPQQPLSTQASTGAAVGEVIKAGFTDSKVYRGTWREYWVYVPRQLDRSKPAPVMVFQDGIQYNAPTVFDDLIEKKASIK